MGSMSVHQDIYRGSWRGRGGSRSAWSPRTTNSSRVGSQPPTPPKPLGPVIDSIDIKTLLIEEEAPKIRDVEYVASYNWLDVKSPVIVVPGSPPAWTPLAIDRQLKPDSEDVFRDINAARFASHPLEPTVRALETMQPDFDLQSVDIVGCGSTVGNLLRFAGSMPRPFRFDIDVIGETVFFVRKENSPTELITDLYGYGHTFPEAYTTWDADARNSCSHQRIVRYDFSGVHLLVRTETDGYVKLPDAKPSSAAPKLTSQSSLEDLLRATTVTSSSPSQDQNLQVKVGGTRISQNQIFDIKTRADYKIFDMNEILPRLWVNQTSKFLLAYHKSGLFDKPEVKDVRQDVLRWEKSNCELLARFHTLLKRIVDVARDADTQQCEVSWDGRGSLCITEQIGEGRRALPIDLVQLLEAS